jgi:hypothetical protein
VFSPELSALSSKAGELRAFYERAAFEAAAEFCGGLGERTEKQLRRSGYNPIGRYFPTFDDGI